MVQWQILEFGSSRTGTNGKRADHKTKFASIQHRALQTRAGTHEVPMKHKSAGKSAAVVASSFGFIAAGFL
jgi:hypothetical protein